MEDSTDFEISDSENVADGITEEKQPSDAKPRSVRDTANSCEPEMYHGVMVKPLSSFGEFGTDLNSQEWPWVCDRTSGEVHKDMKLVSKLYNQDLKLPSAALEFIMQSSVVPYRPNTTYMLVYDSRGHRFRTQLFEAVRLCTIVRHCTMVVRKSCVCQKTSIVTGWGMLCIIAFKIFERLQLYIISTNSLSDNRMHYMRRCQTLVRSLH
ncbi:hypothetical protein OXX79_001883 [Metschnikowia pulcherrima]